MNEIRTWRQGKFIDNPKYRRMPDEWKESQIQEEHLLVRPSHCGNAICKCLYPDDAKWIASRLNLASILEQLTYDFVMEKDDAEDRLRKFVEKKLKEI